MKKVAAALLAACLLLVAGCEMPGTAASALKIGQVQYAAHGTRSFAVATVVMNGEKIALAHLEEYQYLNKTDFTPVPNSDKEFGAALADPTMGLASKRKNSEAYSANMGGTQTLLASYKGIEGFVKGKTIADLEKLLSEKSTEEMVDAVTSSTLVDTKGYVEAIVAAAKAAIES